MKDYLAFSIDGAACHSQVASLATLLESKSALSERNDILNFFKDNQHLSALIGTFFPYVGRPNRLAFEYNLFGDFVCDIAVGDTKSQQYGFVELEDAKHNSVFINKKRSAPYWSPRFEQGYSQVVDWFWKLQDMSSTQEFVLRFGTDYIKYEGMLIVGRDQFLDIRAQQRLAWRQDKVLVDSKRIHILTYDELLRQLQYKLTTYF